MESCRYKRLIVRGREIKVPRELLELMADISREVIRGQPVDISIYIFIAAYLEVMLKAREEAFGMSFLLDILNV